MKVEWQCSKLPDALIEVNGSYLFGREPFFDTEIIKKIKNKVKLISLISTLLSSRGPTRIF